MAPNVSVVITTYNQSRYIEQTIRSVLEQSYRDFEVVVVDDGSTDETPRLLARFGDQITVVRQANRGVAGSRNTGVRHARGSLVALLDGDDLWHPDKLTVQVNAAREHPESGLIVVEGVMFDGSVALGSSLLGDRAKEIFSETDNQVTGSFYELFLNRNFIMTVSQVMIPKEILESVGPSDEAVRLSSDYDLYLRIASKYRVTFLKDKLTYWRYSPTSSSGPDILRIFRFAHDDFQIWTKQLRSAPPARARMIRDNMARRINELALTAYYFGRRHNRVYATRFLLSMLRWRPFSIPLLLSLTGLCCPQFIAGAFGPIARRLAGKARI